jgi:2-(1,2-epoxy-1,2-dihydrophenyl)acetyl-CoA isomerase
LREGEVQYKDIILEKERNIATLILNRPEKMNAVSIQTREEIVAALAEVNEDEDMRVLILTGAGDRAFCAGVDVGVMSARIAGEVKEVTRRQLTQRMGYQVPLFREIRVPTVVAINGVAAGMGVSFIAACDIRIASDKARFTCAWVNRGLVPDGAATYLLPQIVGIEKALELFYTGDVINAEEALRIGLVSRVVPHDDLMKTVRELAEKIAAGPPIALELAKYGVYRGLESDMKGALDYENYAIKVCTSTEDYKEGVTAFLEKRKAEFKGR